jgi:mRNA interferase RelE/StbE
LKILDQGKRRYEVLIDKRVEKDLENLPYHIVERFLQSLDEFEKDPLRQRPKFDTKSLKGLPKNTFRLRIGDYRVLYSVDSENMEVKITMIVHRKKVYKR